ncbi:MAG: hypothetical protein IBJ15_00220 [Alphaproteobacteria bacterium]|nr:hypothetical protein [Alphaproteobacteria bacterium]
MPRCQRESLCTSSPTEDDAAQERRSAMSQVGDAPELKGELAAVGDQSTRADTASLSASDRASLSLLDADTERFARKMLRDQRLDDAFASLMSVPIGDLDTVATRAALDIIPDGESATQNDWQRLGRKLLVPLLAMHVAARRNRGEAADRASFLASIEAAFNSASLVMGVESIVHEQLKMWVTTTPARTEAQRAAIREFVELPRLVLSATMNILVIHVRIRK